MSRTLRIAHLAMSAQPASVGGLEVVVDRLIRQQQALGHDVTLVTRWKQWKALQLADFPYRSLPLPPRLPASMPFYSVGMRLPVDLAVRYHQWREKFDLWHIHWLYPTAWMAHGALTSSGTPMVVTPHGADLQVEELTGYGFRRYAKHDKRVRDLAPKIQAVTAISDSIYDCLLELAVDADQITRIPNGVDAERIDAARSARAQTRVQLGLDQSTPLILTVARNETRKGLHLIPEIVANLMNDGREIRWIIVGAGVTALAELVRFKGVADKIDLKPPIKNSPGCAQFPPQALAELYAAADVFAFPSLSESFGLVAIEAMAAGTPFVGNNVPGIRDVVTNEVDGLLCDPGNPKDMAAAICRLLDNRALAAKLREGGLKTAREHDWAKVAERYDALYQSITDRRTR